MQSVKPSGGLSENVQLREKAYLLLRWLVQWQMIAVADVDMRCWCRSDLGSSQMYLGHANHCECKYVLKPPPPHHVCSNL